MEYIKYIEDGKVISEFTTVQALGDFIIERTRRRCEAEYILSQKKRDRILKNEWFIRGLYVGILIFVIALGISKYFKN